MQYKVLFVEAASNVRVNELLHNLDLKYVTVKGAAQALMQYEVADFDLTIILSDDNSMTIDLTQKIINLKPTHYIIALCNTLHPSEAMEMVKKGVSGFITQPFTDAKLALELQKYLFQQKNMLLVDL